MTHKLFVPVDGSSCALRAVHHAVSLAKRMGDCFIYLVHAHEEPLIYGEIAVYVPREKMQQLQRDQSEAVLASGISIVESAGVPFEKHILTGSIAEVLAEDATALGCDAIVMGTRGSTALGNMLMGSIATKVIHLSNIPVTLVK